MELGNEIAVLRKAKGWTQKELATRADVAITAIRRCEQRGEISLPRLIKLTQALNADITLIDRAEPHYRSWEDIVQDAPAASPMVPARKPRIGSIFAPA